MDTRTGKGYATREEALAAGVPPDRLVQVRESMNRVDLAEALRSEDEIVGGGPFKKRVYKRTPAGGLVRVR